MSVRTHRRSSPAPLALSAIAALSPAAFAQIQLSGPAFNVGGGFSGMSMLPGTNAAVSGSMTGDSISISFTGDTVASFLGAAAAGTYNGTTGTGAVVPFTVGALPVMIGDASMHGGFKLVASGGNGVPDGNDPIVTCTVLGRLYQQIGNTVNLFSDPWLSAIEFSRTYVQNGNGLQIISETYGPAHSGYIFTPGNYYLYEQYLIQTSYTTNGGIQPARGMALEFGGALTAGTYTGFDYTVDWRTVPAPGAAATLAIGGLVMSRRRRN